MPQNDIPRQAQTGNSPISALNVRHPIRRLYPPPSPTLSSKRACSPIPAPWVRRWTTPGSTETQNLPAVARTSRGSKPPWEPPVADAGVRGTECALVRIGWVWCTRVRCLFVTRPHDLPPAKTRRLGFRRVMPGYGWAAVCRAVHD